MFKKLLPLLLGLGFIFVACQNEQSDQIDALINEQFDEGQGETIESDAVVDEPIQVSETLEDNEEIVEREVQSQVQAQMSTDEGYASTSDEKEIIEKVKKFLYKGEYDKALELIGNSNDPYLKYYRGMIYYAKMKLPQYSTSQRHTYRDIAIKTLKEVGYDAPDDNLRARAKLWYGMAVHLNYESLSWNRKAIGAFWEIQSTRLKDTEVYNDSLYYTGLVYRKMGWYPQALRHFKMLRTADKVDTLVYDPLVNDYIGIRAASEKGIELVNKIKYAEPKEKKEPMNEAPEEVEEVVEEPVEETPAEVVEEVTPVEESTPAPEEPVTEESNISPETTETDTNATPEVDSASTPTNTSVESSTVETNTESNDTNATADTNSAASEEVLF